MMTKGYGAYGSSRHGTGAYQAAASQPRMFQNIRLMDELLAHVFRAHTADLAGKQAEEMASVDSAALILRGLNAMLDKRQGRVAENLGKTYRSLIVALHGVCSMVDTQGQYPRLYDAILELRNAWATINGVAFAALPPEMAAGHATGTAAGLPKVAAQDLLGLSDPSDE
jgi:flagellin-specific chaperone FliS